MNSDEKDKFEHEKSNEDPLNFNSSSMSSDWQFCGANLSSGPVNLVRPSSSLAFCREDLIGSSPCSSASMVDSLGTALWDHPTSVENFGYCDVNTANNLSTSNQLGIRRAPHASLRSDIGWNPPSSMIKGSLFPPSALGTLPESLTHFPADSGFIERAARFSCFNGGNLSNMMNPFGIPENGGLYPITGGLVPGPLEIFPGGCPKPISGARSDKNEMNIEASRDVHLLPTQGTSQGSPLKNEGKSESFARSRDEARQSVGGSGNESDEAEFSGGGSGGDNPSMLEDNGGEGSAKGLDRKKRKRSGEDAELDKAKGAPQLAETVKDGETHQKLEHNPNSNTSKPTGKNNKQGTQGSDPPKEEYIHVRARRGQATNSHSLAERVRREKISERMKFLQDLVPGCSKVTGKAVMLDEIINYVQSLQRQVEFLSMKLAAVNPRLDFNLEGILAKDILQSRAGPSSALGFSHDMPMAYPPMHPQPTPAGVVQLALTGIGSPSDAVRRAMHNEMTHVSGGFRDPSQVHHPWEDELNNVVQMGFASVTNSSSQEADGSLPPSHVKVEL